MGSIPYLYINVIGLCCFCVMLITFLAAKKTPEIKAFIVVLVAFILWFTGSVLMRLQIYPGIPFWYYVSILAMFSIAALLYYFVCSFLKIKSYATQILWTILTAVLLFLTVTGNVLEPPVVSTDANGGTVFLYNMDARVITPFVVMFLEVMSIARVLLRSIKERGFHAPGIPEIIIGCAIVALGNLMQIIPGNTFPWDALSGIIFALLIFYALCRRRMFSLKLLVSRGLLLMVICLVWIVIAVNWVAPVSDFVSRQIPQLGTNALAVVVVLFTLGLTVLFYCMKHLVDKVYIREEHQNQRLQEFTLAVSKSLDTHQVMDTLSNMIVSEIRVGQVYVMLADGDRYKAQYSSNPLLPVSFSIRADSPCLKGLKEDEPYVILKDFRSGTLASALWAEEHRLFDRLKLDCIVPIKDGNEIVGLVFLCGRGKSSTPSYSELSFLSVASSIAAIALKNAVLYEQMFREARIDPLTGVNNYRCFVERVNQEFERSGQDPLALVYVDFDDFKLYNQLNGTAQGDRVLQIGAKAIEECVGNQGTVFRSGGKIFAVLLPGMDGRRAEMLTEQIQYTITNRVRQNSGPSERGITVSCGICVSPFAASTAKELMENADMAVYHAKNAGKNRIVLYRRSSGSVFGVSQRAREIIERAERMETDSPFRQNYNTIFALSAAIDAKDHYTYHHSLNVALYASILATGAGLSEEAVLMIYEAAILHDIGKISIPENILNKTTRLDDNEYGIIKGHVNNSIEMMRHLPAMDHLIPAVLSHHERWDGKGYPRGVAGENIPVAGRCLAIADSFDAMTSDRPYHKGVSLEVAVEQLEKNAGTQFDPVLTKLFVSLIHRGEISIQKK